jgi:hypothetical protein
MHPGFSLDRCSLPLKTLRALRINPSAVRSCPTLTRKTPALAGALIGERFYFETDIAAISSADGPYMPGIARSSMRR